MASIQTYLSSSDINGEKTKADDVSASDRQIIRSLATAFIYENLDRLGVAFRERKNDNSRKTSCLWGTSLDTLLKRDHNHYPYAKIPIIFDEILKLLETRGIEVWACLHRISV